MASKPRKVRKGFYNMKAHKRAKKIAAHLSEKLAKEHNKRALSIRKGDIVKVMRGNFKGKEGKVSGIDRAKLKIFVDKVMRKKSDGTEMKVAIDPSKVVLIELEKSDKKRTKPRKGEKK
ncbi:MAG: 50S ribosomal protein L24 [Candidatus Diapherotrites archaeon]|nr:50S ribosomal protein L24 [Candidatus Diapherotrites archaeon]